MRSFYYGKITNKKNTIETTPYSVKTDIQRIWMGFSITDYVNIKLYSQTDKINMEI